VANIISQPTILGIYLGLGFGLIYLLLHLYAKQAPDFNKFATIVLSCVGAVAGWSFGYIALNSPNEDLGILTDQRLPMVLGAGAIIWLAVEQAFKIYQPVIQQCINKKHA
jgi:hypothetical protein